MANESELSGTLPKHGIKLSFEPYNLKLKHVFRLANSTRTKTPVVLVKLSFNGIIGYGEASLPPYMDESQFTVSKFLSELNLSQFHDPLKMDEILDYIGNFDKKNTAAKASIDIALHDLVGKLIGKPVYKILGLSKNKTPNTSFTIGIDSPDVLKEKVEEAKDFKFLKIKLGSYNDKQIIETIRSVSDTPLCVDVNQGWKKKEQALEMIHWLKEQDVEFVEQPMPAEMIEETAWLTQHSPLPIIADEAVQRLSDIEIAKDVYSGINIKLMKCTGIREANNMIDKARKYNMKAMIGCMTETSCAISAAAQLSPKVDWADLDGNLLISNDPYSGITINNGKIILNDLPGIGISNS